MKETIEGTWSMNVIRLSLESPAGGSHLPLWTEGRLRATEAKAEAPWD